MREELAAARAFVALLEEERAALLAADPSPLPDIAARKVAAAQRMAQLSRERGTRPTAELAALSRDALSRIRANAALVDARLRSVGEALAVLMRGHGAAAQVYTADGRFQATPVRAARARA